jgi:crotonobetainyl-CoA:carnitine CoA-transferase CaiB-like acyl-CoA transferase
MRQREGMSSGLDGIRVIDFGQYIAGPLTAMLLADQGADVIRVEPPGGPLWDTPANATRNCGKRSITLHLKQPDDLAVATRQIASADVVIENFRPWAERPGHEQFAQATTGIQCLYILMETHDDACADALSQSSIGRHYWCLT